MFTLLQARPILCIIHFQMSNIYIQEPHPNGHVILQTTSGDIDIEVWSKETPKAARNFIQLCLEGYYINTIFHRVVPGFIVQGGDPTGTGHGGESIYGEPFADEFHSRLRFVRRGLVAMANAGPNDNGSQFFFTLDNTPELQNKHTIFGRVVGDTLFNVLKMGEVETDENERPLYPTRITNIEVLSNPFDDIVPRITTAERVAQLQRAEVPETTGKKRKKEKKNLALLSFNDDTLEPTDSDGPGQKLKSSHDLLVDDPRLAKDTVVSLEELSSKTVLDQGKEKMEYAFNKSKALAEKISAGEKKTKGMETENKMDVDEDNDFDRKMKEQIKKKHERSKAKDEEFKAETSTSSQIDKLRQDIKNLGKRKDNPDEEEKKKKKVSLVEEQRSAYLTGRNAVKRGKKRGGEDELMAKLAAFQQKLSSVSHEPASIISSAPTVSPDAITIDSPSVSNARDPSQPCALHHIPNCESCNDTFGLSVDTVSEEGWLSHRLIFEKDYKGKDLMQRRENVDDYLVIDPRERKAEAEKEEREKKAKRTGGISEVFKPGRGGRKDEKDKRDKNEERRR